MVYRNCWLGISASGIPMISTGTVFCISVFGGGDCNIANFASIVKSVVLRFNTSALRCLISVFNWLIYVWRSFVVICWKGFGIGNCL